MVADCIAGKANAGVLPARKPFNLLGLCGTEPALSEVEGRPRLCGLAE
jgi:hypothetical protein